MNTKKLYFTVYTDSGKNLSFTVSNPKAGVTPEQIEAFLLAYDAATGYSSTLKKAYYRSYEDEPIYPTT